MRAVVQRVTSSKVSVDGKTVGEIGKGFNVLLGVVEGDTDEQAILLAGKIARLRVFEDENGKMNLSVNDVGGEILAISQFTLCADCKRATDRLLRSLPRPMKRTDYMSCSAPSSPRTESGMSKKASSARIWRSI